MVDGISSSVDGFSRFFSFNAFGTGETDRFGVAVQFGVGSIPGSGGADPIPEPGTMVMGALGIAGLLARRRQHAG